MKTKRTRQIEWGLTCLYIVLAVILAAIAKQGEWTLIISVPGLYYLIYLLTKQG